MAKFIVIKRNTLIFIVLIIILFVFSSFMLLKFINKSDTTTISNKISSPLEVDLTGDGKNDQIIIDESKGDYIVKVLTNSKEYILTPNNNSHSLGSKTSNDKIYINTMDLSRDSIPEIIVQTYSNSKPTNYIFKFIDSTFKNILTTEENLIGILNSNNTKTPNLVSILSSKSDEYSRSFIIKQDTIKDVSFGKIKLPGYATSQKLIDAIEKPYEVLEMPDIFAGNISSEEIALLWNLEKDTYIYSFENGFFKDVNWDNSGDAISIEWTLHFNVAKKIGESTSIAPLDIYIKLDKTPYGDYKICSMKKI